MGQIKRKQTYDSIRGSPEDNKPEIRTGNRE